MSTLHPFGWDLPPGVSNADIEGATDADYDNCPDCEETDEACRKDENDEWREITERMTPRLNVDLSHSPPNQK